MGYAGSIPDPRPKLKTTIMRIIQATLTDTQVEFHLPSIHLGETNMFLAKYEDGIWNVYGGELVDGIRTKVISSNSDRDSAIERARVFDMALGVVSDLDFQRDTQYTNPVDLMVDHTDEDIQMWFNEIQA